MSLIQKVRRLPVWLLIPMVGILSAIVAISWFGANELMASQALRKQFAKMRAEGIPVDDETMTITYESRTHQEGSKKWIEASGLVTQLADQGQRALGIDFSSPNMIDLLPSIEWKDQDRTDAFLDSLQPAIELLKDASTAPKPIWHPMNFEGVGTLLPYTQRAREVANVLKYDAEFSIYKSDTKRAIRDLELLMATSLASESDLLVMLNARQAIDDMRWRLIQRSLLASVWSEDELKQVAELVGVPLDIAAVWPTLIDSQLAITRSMFSDGDVATWRNVLGRDSAWWASRFARLPTSQLAFTESNLLWRDAAEDGFDGILARSKEISLEQEGQVHVLANLLAPYSLFGYWFVRSEDLRRLTLTAIAIKQFQMINDTWPKRLSDLETIGSDSEGWTSVQSGRFGYRVVDDQAVVWDLTKKHDFTSVPIIEEYENFSQHKAMPENAQTWTSAEGSVVTIR